jgi:hypothetical protein
MPIDRRGRPVDPGTALPVPWQVRAPGDEQPLETRRRIPI